MRRFPRREYWFALCRQGQDDVRRGNASYRHRELFEEPIDEIKLFPPTCGASWQNDTAAKAGLR